jgi:hypothetical protein
MEKEYEVEVTYVLKTTLKIPANSKKEALLLVKHCTYGQLSIIANDLVAEYEHIPPALHEGLEQKLKNISWELSGERPTSVKIISKIDK